MNVYVTGVRGFLGSSLRGVLEKRGHKVRGSASSPAAGFDTLRVGERPPEGMFAGWDVVVHCAHDFAPGAAERNVRGAELLLDAIGARRSLFVSSYSARPDAQSEYGIAKHRIETMFAGRGGCVVRPGLVIGAGGLFERNLRFLLRSPAIPLLGGGRDRIPVVALDDFTDAMALLVESGRTGVFNLANSEMPRLRDLAETALRVQGRRAAIVPIPDRLAEGALGLFERLGLRLPVTAAGLRALKIDRRPIHASDLASLLGRETPLDVMLRSAIEVHRRG